MELQWELMTFTLFVCLGAGIFALQGLLVVLGKSEKIQLPAMIASLVAIGIGGIGSFLHLQHWERIFSGFGHLTSGITQELIAIVVFVIALVVYFIFYRRSEDNRVPKWCGVMALIIGTAFVLVVAHSYNMAARPVWDTLLLWIYYLSNAALFGALAIALIAGIRGDETANFAAKFAFIVGIVQAAATAAYTVFFVIATNTFTNVGYYFDPTHPTKSMADPQSVFGSILFGKNAFLFWVGIVAVGLLIPIVTAFLAKKKGPKPLAIYAGIGFVGALIGGMCFRVILYILGFSVFMFY
jgi:anaerobic dimethyl sulfoxide reductase subunit C (anchor subunit)